MGRERARQLNRVHYAGYDHGARSNTLNPADVTCLICVRKLWADVAVAHYRAFGASPITEHGKRIRNAIRDSESAIRGETTR